MRCTGWLILYVVATAIALGGVGDLTIRALFEVHKRFLGTADVPAATTSLILHLLHALGGGLVGIGIASFALVHFAVRRGERWALWTMLAAVVASEGANAVGMYAVVRSGTCPSRTSSSPPSVSHSSSRPNPKRRTTGKSINLDRLLPFRGALRRTSRKCV